MGVSVGLRSRLPAWPLSPTADGPAIVVGEVHHPVKGIESQAPEWLTIPERGLYTGVAIFGAVGSGKTSACMHPFARQLLSWQATNPARRAAALILEVKGDPEPRQRSGRDGATPFFRRWRRTARGGVSHRVSHPSPRLRGGRSRLHVSLREGSPARTRAGTISRDERPHA